MRTYDEDDVTRGWLLVFVVFIAGIVLGALIS